jgi:hypothetical protein
MSNEMRLFGREVTIRLTQDGAMLSEVTAVKSLTFETRQRIITEGYLGESAQRQDEIFDEVGGSIALHLEGADILLLQQAVVQRSSKRSANPTKISINFRAQFPNGIVARFTVPDVKFDPIPFNVSGRDAYVDTTLTYKSNRYLLSV